MTHTRVVLEPLSGPNYNGPRTSHCVSCVPRGNVQMTEIMDDREPC